MSLSFRRLSLLGLLALLIAFAPQAHLAAAAGPYVVTKTDDTDGTCLSGSNCSLREAIKAANAAPGSITFNIPTNDPGYQVSGDYWRITVSPALGALPALTGGNITIDGSAGGVPKIELSGGGVVTNRGLYISSANNVVRGLIINGFIKVTAAVDPTGAGIIINGSAATGNTITNCYIGTNYSGTIAGGTASVNNDGAGIMIQNGASSNVIDDNVISGNGGYGVYIYTLFSSSSNIQQNNKITNNRIGVTADGTSALGNDQDGVYVGDNSNDNVVGPGNVIGGNGPAGSSIVYGVNIGGRLLTDTAYISGNRVIGNKIGTNKTSTAALANAGGGVLVTASTNTVIGGPNGSPSAAGGDGNLISGNTGNGVEVKDDSGSGTGTVGVVIQNNWIGLDATGAAALANEEAGVLLWQTANGVMVGPDNVISGNALYGVWMLANLSRTGNQQVRNNTITANAIGTNAAASAGVPNNIGVLLEGGTFGNTISGNQIANNSSAGISLKTDTNSAASPTSTTISANTIASNGPTGIQLLDVSSGNTIGGSAPGDGNTISGHTGAGIDLQASQNTVKGNTVSANAVGVKINVAATDNVVDGNSVTGNTNQGIYVVGAGVIRNKITRTTTNNNGGKGIELASGGNLGNQAGRPGLSGLTLTGTNLSGTVTNGDSCGAGGCTIEVFTHDQSLLDEGPTYLTSFTSASSFSDVSLAGCKPHLIFTITDDTGNTSEFTNPIDPFSSQCVPSAPAVSITTDPPLPPRSVVPGGSTTYVHHIKNTGTGAGAVTVDLSQQPNSWAALLNNACQGVTLAPNATCDFSVQVSVPGNAQKDESNVATITVSIGAASGQQVDTTTVLLNPALDLTPLSQTKDTGPGQPISFSHTLANQGNGADTFAITVTPPLSWSYSVQPAGPIALAQNASITVTVTYTPTAGIASPPDYDATVTASSINAPATATKTVTDTTHIVSAAVPQIASAVTPASIDPGELVTITYTLSNVGNQAGTFNLAFAQPPGWSVTTAPPASETLSQGASTIVTATLTAPANALAGAHYATLTATADATPFASASKTDQITVKPRAALSWSPDQSNTRAPNQIYTDTLTLTNSGNFTDTIGLAASSSRGWSVRSLSPTVTLDPGASAPVQVELTIPPGQVADTSATTTLTATSSLPPISATAHITTTIAAVSGAALAPPAQILAVDAGKPVTFTLTLQNSGSISQTFTLTTTAAPGGWSASLAPLSTPTLLPGETRPITVALQAPAGAPIGSSASVTITATCQENACPDATATVTAQVGQPYDVTIAPPCNGSALPGAIVTCVHTVTNTGLQKDNFAITAESARGWNASVAPPSLSLAPGASATITATLVIPTSAPAGIVHMLFVRARSTATSGPPHEIVDTTTILQFARVNFTPSQSKPIQPGRSVLFRNVVLNTGNGSDQFTFSASQEFDWHITITPTQTASLAPGISYPVTVQVDVPAGAKLNALNRIVVRATSVFSPTVFDQLVDTAGLQDAPSTIIYMPLMSRP